MTTLDKNKMTNLYVKGLDIIPNDVAKILHYDNIYNLNIIGYQYYQFDKHRWTKIDGKGFLLQKFKTKIIEDLRQVIDKNMNIHLLKDNKKLLTMIKKLKCSSFQKEVIDKCEVFFHSSSIVFTKKLDENPYLLGFNNGIYDLSLDKFRNGRKDDYISMTTGLGYREYKWKDKNVIEILEFIHKVLPDYDIQAYVLSILASFLDGNNITENFHIWKSNGRNGITKLMELFEKCIGEYGCKLPVNILTNKKNDSNKIQNNLVKTKGKRFVHLRESRFIKRKRINLDSVKEIISNNIIETEDIYKNSIKFKPQIKAIFINDHLPDFSYNREIYQKIRTVEFKSSYVVSTDLDKTDRYQLGRDTSVSEKIIKWKGPFMWILLEYYKKGKVFGIKVPEEILTYNKQY